MADRRTPVLYLAPYVDIGGADKGTIDWFRFLDRDRFRPSLITTQPSLNRRLAEIAPYADELWELPQLMRGDDFPRFILAFIQSRGVELVHIMNSRLGFDLLPDVAALEERPKIVVQLHTEEPSPGGHFQYVTTRYGNLVDAFSVSSHALSRRLAAYEVASRKRRVIRTGVDAEREFCPGRVKPIDGLDSGRFQILFPARLAPEKDPLLMLEVATRAREAGLDFQIQVVGDGGLSTVLREEIASRGLEREVILNGASLEVARWYAACDAVLLTSHFEGLPYVAYEAMAMALPVIAPAFPGIVELVTPQTGILVADRGDIQAYVDAFEALVGDPARRARMGEAARARVCAQHSLERMGSDHVALYEDLLQDRPISARRSSQLANGRAHHHRSSSEAFRGRRPGTSPLVSVIVPCLNHGRYLPDCLHSVASQTYRPIETIVVDDGSSDPETLSVLSRLEAERRVIVVRLRENRGPAAARNAGIRRATGRYVLPLDADDLLMPNAICDLVEQLSNAGEQIGFVYPNLQFFGNRSGYLEAPRYDLHALLEENYCGSAALFDREVFDQGFRYPEDIILGPEDWDFVLSLAEAGIYGQPARAKSVLHRRVGFNRSDLARTSLDFEAVAAARHPRLFEAQAQIKGEWNPSLTVVALDPIAGSLGESMPNLLTAAASQTCPDFELITRTSAELGPTELGARLRRIPCELAGSRAQALRQALAVARGRYVLAAYGSPAGLLADRALVEKVLRIMQGYGGMLALALAEAVAEGSPFRLLADQEVAAATLGAVCWTARGQAAPSPALHLPNGRPIETLAGMIAAQVPVQWRHLPRLDSWSPIAGEDGAGAQLGEPLHSRMGDLAKAEPALPQSPPGFTGSLGSQAPWRPPETRVLYRHRHSPSGRYLYSNSEDPPPDSVLDMALGALRQHPLQGTVSLVCASGERALAIGEPREQDDPSLLGFMEQAPLPLLDELRLARHRRTGEEVLLAGSADPLVNETDAPRTIGYIEPYPIHPRLLPHLDVGYGLLGLVRTVDYDARRHRYGAGQFPAGVPAGELGALLAEHAPDTDPLWIDDQGQVTVAGRTLTNGRPSLRGAMQWTAAPLTWSGMGRFTPKLRASARRAYDSTRFLMSARANGAHPGDPAGYLLRSATPRSVPLYAAVHPVTGDQLLSNTTGEPTSLGYHHITLLGYLVAQAPVTGRRGEIRVAAPWASRFGLPAVSV